MSSPKNGYGLHMPFFHLLGLVLGVPWPGVSTPKFLGVRPSGVRHSESCVLSLSFSPTDSGNITISLLMNITMNQLGGASVIAKFHS